MKIFNKIFGFNNSVNIRGNNNITMSSTNGGSRVTINGREYHLPPGNVSIVNNKVYLNGQPYNLDDPELNKANMLTEINITVEGNTGNIKCNGSVNVNGDAAKVDTTGSVTVGGNVAGGIDTTGSVTVKGDVKGNIDTTGRVIVYGDHTGSTYN
jgi:uncharacterized protein (DUF342 family)